MKKGFTLIELLAVIVILAVISLITIPMLLNVVEDSRKGAFKDSMYSAFNAVEYYVVEKGLGDVPESGIEAEFLNLKNNNFESGRFVKNIDGTLVAEFVSDGEYCATGSLTNLNVSKGECEINAPVVDVVVNGKEVSFTITDDNGIVSYVVNTNSEEPTEWPAIEETTSITETLTAETAGTYYIHVKNKYGKVTTKEYEIGQNAFCAYEVGYTWTFEYSGNIEEFTVPCDGTYKLEVWGAQGATYNGGQGGKGGYSEGKTLLTSTDTLYVCCGGTGGVVYNSKGAATAGYNGGGRGTSYGQHGNIGTSGGGATHIAKVTGTLSEIGYTSFVEENNGLIVAGGGGGIGNNSLSMNKIGGVGGGLTGGGSSDGTTAAGTQTTGASFGVGGDGVSYNNGSGGGGGGGLYGGLGGSNMTSGAGGSGYIGGVTDGITESGVHEGNGYAKITLVSFN